MKVIENPEGFKRKPWPWRDWADDHTRIAEIGLDFGPREQDAFMAAGRQWASRNGYHWASQVTEDRLGIIFRMWPKGEPPVRKYSTEHPGYTTEAIHG